jgi:hypothetical protein
VVRLFWNLRHGLPVVPRRCSGRGPRVTMDHPEPAKSPAEDDSSPGQTAPTRDLCYMADAQHQRSAGRTFVRASPLAGCRELKDVGQQVPALPIAADGPRQHLAGGCPCPNRSGWDAELGLCFFRRDHATLILQRGDGHMIRVPRAATPTRSLCGCSGTAHLPSCRARATRRTSWHSPRHLPVGSCGTETRRNRTVGGCLQEYR